MDWPPGVGTVAVVIGFAAPGVVGAGVGVGGVITDPTLMRNWSITCRPAGWVGKTTEP